MSTLHEHDQFATFPEVPLCLWEVLFSLMMIWEMIFPAVFASSVFIDEQTPLLENVNACPPAPRPSCPAAQG